MLRACTLCAAICLAFLAQARGAEVVHLRSGFDLGAQSHTEKGSIYAFQTQTGTIEVPADQVIQIEDLGDPPAVLSSSNKPQEMDMVSTLGSVAMSEAGTPEFSRFVRSVAEVESALKQSAKSPKGATGVMQLMPETARELGVAAADTRDNIRGGARYLKQLLAAYHGEAILALAAYNAGPGAVKRYGGVPPYPETRLYIQKVLREYSKLQPTAAVN